MQRPGLRFARSVFVRCDSSCLLVPDPNSRKRDLASIFSSLGVNTPLANGVGHTIDRKHVSCDAIVNVMSFGVTDDVVERRLHNGLELLVDHGFLPEVSLTVLHPLEVGSCDAAGVGQNVRNHEYALLGQHVVGSGGRRAVRPFGEDAALHAIDVAARDDVFGCGWNQNLAIGDEQIGGVGSFRAGESVDGPVLLAELQQRLNVNAVLVKEASADFGYADDFVSGVVHELGGIGADIAESLNDHSGAVTVDIELAASFVADDHHAAAGGFAASAGAANVDGLSGYHGGDGLAHVHGVGVHHPGHDLFIGVDVGGGNVFLGADGFDKL